jgi:hypothetical protein
MAAGGSALLVLIGGGAAGVAALTKEPQVVNAAGREAATARLAPGIEPPAADLGDQPPAMDKGIGDAEPDPNTVAGHRLTTEADRTATRAPRKVQTPKKPGTPATPVITTQTVSETRSIPYRTRLVRDPSMPRGSRRIQTEGVPGIQTLRYLVTYADGRQTDRRLIDATVTREPQQRVIAFGGRGRWGGGDHHRDCGPESHPCFPLGRSACPDEKPVDTSALVENSARAEKLVAGSPAEELVERSPAEMPVGKSGSVTVLDQDLALLDANQLDALALEPGLVC